MAITKNSFYNTPSPETTQPISQPLSPNRNTSPAGMVTANTAVAVSWVGLVIAVIALRVVYEMSD
jgi:hypothetical protein